MVMYRNIVLTVIAVCLVWICARDLSPWRTAQALPGELAPTEPGKPVPVTIQVDERNGLPVVIMGIKTSAGRGLPVTIQDAASGSLRSAGPIETRVR
jgi:hypothetical protein